MKKFFSKPSKFGVKGGNSEPPPGPATTTISRDEVQTQFAVIKMKNGQVIVQFPLLDITSQKVDVGTALELCSAGLNTLAQVFRQQFPQEASRIAVVGALPPEMLKPPEGRG